MSRFEASERHAEDTITAIHEASHRIATAITQGFKHMADAQTKSLADLNTALTNVADAISAEIAALQTALTNSGQPDDSGQIETAVTNLNALTASLKASIPAAAPVKPVVSSMSPTSGPAAGLSPVSLSGSGFTGATGVTVGGTAVTALTVNSDTQLTFTTPAGTGSAPVVVTTPGGTNANSTLFNFV